ncbi:HemY protein [Candidatus Kinetoplastibacterium blastocrithidii TCC012E]|uniref:HemY protein n=1 Tax=Candidatus Kinetoplastidibacterium blastocrithidiae TCC012E TaxID=1208922 RepID=M1M3A7_9PROT|nr:heme biosynthesis HemY N-terminal domain-containing protein [Candidatus Kinetoplastibacterium blastocrithidii]AFZ83530.1 hypothetical protein CKBE_00341 [Candidatus Kinetoplastibacterium blastocrithidii (ex Strigomonas culicis)]AGF49649.1 HemY protein [Candidatus Kinetoplastibacterium blastocrithidii TCC012E]
MRSWFRKLIIVFVMFLLSLSFPGNNNNYVTVVLDSWHLRLSLIPAFFIAIFLNLFLYSIFRLFYYFLTILPRINSYRKKKLFESNRRSIEKGLLFFLENRFSEALDIFLRLIYSDIGIRSKIIIVLCSAKAYFLLGQNDKSMEMIKYAEKISNNNPEFLEDVLTLKTSILIDMKLPKDAADCLLKLNSIIEVQYPIVLQLSLKVEIMLGNHTKAIDNARLLLYDNGIDKNYLYEAINNSGSELLKDMINKGLPLKQQWKNFTHNERMLPEIALVYSRALIANGNYSESEKLLELVLSKKLNNDILYEYTKCKSDQVSHRLSKVEYWIEIYGDSPDLLNALGILCLHSQLWGQAEYYFSKSLDIRDDAQIHMLFGIMYKCLNREEDTIIQLFKSLKSTDSLFIPEIVNSYRSSLDGLTNNSNNKEFHEYSDNIISSHEQYVDDQYFDSAPLPGSFFDNLEDLKTNKD